MGRTFINAVIAALQELYDEGPVARALLIRMDYPKGSMPAFHRPDVFWTEVVHKLKQGILVDGIRRVLAEAAVDHPGSPEVAALLAQSGGAAGRPAPGPVPVPVLALLSDPNRTSKVRLDREARLLQDAAAAGGLTLTIRNAARVSDIVTALRRARPRILHFAGHGLTDGNLVFEDDAGELAEVALPQLADAVAATVGTLECAVLSSCYTGTHADAFRGVARTVAGSVDALPDATALGFTRGFYGAVGGGEPVEQAFRQGSAEAGLPGNRTSGLHFVVLAEAGATP